MVPTKQERYIAAATYLFDLGYFLSFFLGANDKSSAFISFHHEQMNRIIKRIFLPATACFVAWFFTHIYVLMFGLGVCLIGIIISIIAAVYALKGQTKKII